MWPPVFLLTFSRAQGDSRVYSPIRPPGAPSTLVRRVEKQRPVLMDIMERKRHLLISYLTTRGVCVGDVSDKEFSRAVMQ